MNKENYHPNYLAIRSNVKQHRQYYVSTSRNIPSILRRKRRFNQSDNNINSWPQQNQSRFNNNVNNTKTLVPHRNQKCNPNSTIFSSITTTRKHNIHFAPYWWAKRPRVRDQQLPLHLWRNIHKRPRFCQNVTTAIRYRDRATILGLSNEMLSKLCGIYHVSWSKTNNRVKNDVIIEEIGSNNIDDSLSQDRIMDCQETTKSIQILNQMTYTTSLEQNNKRNQES